ncbi:hypothetical protein C8Q80DRAFT_1146746 [Daedaleopsis nitida]|nr:hypothetical protein C8Q80DRAFT_1146746 [Daedaleopsis nitida]
MSMCTVHKPRVIIACVTALLNLISAHPWFSPSLPAISLESVGMVHIASTNCTLGLPLEIWEVIIDCCHQLYATWSLSSHSMLALSPARIGTHEADSSSTLTVSSSERGSWSRPSSEPSRRNLR